MRRHTYHVRYILGCLSGWLVFFSVAVNAADDSAADTEALAVARQVVSDLPNHPKSHLLLGKIQQALSQWDEALSSYQHSLELDPKQSETAVSTAQIYEKKYAYKQAIEWYQKALEIDAKQQGVYEKIGLLYIQLQQTDQAVQAFQNELELFPNHASTHYYLAQRLKEDGKIDEAKKHAQRCMELDERYPEPVYLLAMIAREQKETQKTQELLNLFRGKKSKESDYLIEDASAEPDHNLILQAHSLAGAIYYQQGLDQKAEDHLKKTVLIDPKNEDARFNLVKLYSTTQNIQKLENTWRELHALQPDKVSYMVQLGNLFNALQKWDEALPLLERAFQLEQSAETKQALAQVLITSQKDSARGLQLMLEVVQQDPTAPNYDLLSRAYYVNRNLPLSIEAMQMAVQLEPGNPIYQQRVQKLQTIKQ